MITSVTTSSEDTTAPVAMVTCCIQTTVPAEVNPLLDKSSGCVVVCLHSVCVRVCICARVCARVCVCIASLGLLCVRLIVVNIYTTLSHSHSHTHPSHPSGNDGQCVFMCVCVCVCVRLRLFVFVCVCARACM